MAKDFEEMDKVIIVTDEDVVEGFITDILPDDKRVEITTTGITAGEWKGPDVTNYDEHTKALYKEVKTGLWMHQQLNTYRKAALMIAASRYTALGAGSNIAWLGANGTDMNNDFYASYVTTNGEVYSSGDFDYFHDSFVVAPAFNLKKTRLIYNAGLGAWVLNNNSHENELHKAYREDIKMTLEQLMEYEELDDASTQALADVVDFLHMAEDRLK